MRDARRPGGDRLQVGEHRRPEGRPIHTHGAVVRHSLNVTSTYKVSPATIVMFSSMPFFWVGGLVTGVARSAAPRRDPRDPGRRSTPGPRSI